jgi:hypothetical protein
MSETEWKLFAPISVGGVSLILEYREAEGGTQVRLGGASGVILQQTPFEELVQAIGLGYSWNHPGIDWSPPTLQIGSRQLQLSEGSRRSVLSVLQSLSGSEIPAEAGIATPKFTLGPEGWQQTLIQLAHVPSESPEDAVQLAGEMAFRLLRTSGFTLWLKQPGEPHYALVSRYPRRILPDGPIHTQEHARYVRLIEQSIFHTVQDAQAAPEMAELKELATAWGLHSMLQIPLRYERTLLGVLWLERLERTPWSDSDKLQALALAEALKPHLYLYELRAQEERFVDPVSFQSQTQQAIKVRRKNFQVGLLRMKCVGLEGDAITKIYDIINRSLRPNDVATMLTPGDFALLLTSMKASSGASVVAERILRRVMMIAGSNASVGLGSAVLPEQAEAFESLWKLAEERADEVLGQKAVAG